MSLPAEAETRFEQWMRALEDRHLADLRFSEVSRALRALSSGYVERRATLAARGAFDGAGKRAAYALFYAPLHFLTVSAIVQQLPGARAPRRHLVDLGCGTGGAGAAWASTLSPPPRLTAIDVHPWTLGEAAATYNAFALDADLKRGDLARVRVPASADAVIAGWVLNEISGDLRDTLRTRLLDAASRDASVLIVEPIATRIAPWWNEWSTPLIAAGGRMDEWRVRMPLPDIVQRLDRAAGMRHDELTARSVWLSAVDHHG